MKVNPHIYQAIAHPCTKFKYEDDSILRFKIVRIFLSFFATVFTFGGLYCHAKKHLPRAVRFEKEHDSALYDINGHPDSMNMRDQADLVRSTGGRPCRAPQNPCPGTLRQCDMSPEDLAFMREFNEADRKERAHPDDVTASPEDLATLKELKEYQKKTGYRHSPMEFLIEHKKQKEASE